MGENQLNIIRDRLIVDYSAVAAFVMGFVGKQPILNTNRDCSWDVLLTKQILMLGHHEIGL